MIRIPLRSREGIVIDYALVDDEERDLADLVWWRNDQGYVLHDRPTNAAGKRERWRLHRVVMGLGPGRDDPRRVDHENGNRADCRRANLRIATPGQNAQNVASHSDGTSQYRGVSWNPRRKQWQAKACVAGKQKHIGWFRPEGEDEAGRTVAAWRLANMPYTNEDRKVRKARREEQ